MTLSPDFERFLPLTNMLADHIGGVRFHYSTEDDLQRGIEQLLDGFDFEREWRIDARNRIDFLVRSAADQAARIGIEVKVAGAAGTVEAQCHRYLDSGTIDGLVLVTTKRHHRKIEVKRFDKPFVVCWLGRSGF